MHTSSFPTVAAGGGVLTAPFPKANIVDTDAATYSAAIVKEDVGALTVEGKPLHQWLIPGEP